MAILIKGMEMPKNCGGCFLRFGQCSRRIYMENRPSDCPLNEVPEPHGRLIDADKLKSYWEPDHSRYFDADYFIHTIDVAKSIIPASESKERHAFLPQYELTPRSEEG